MSTRRLNVALDFGDGSEHAFAQLGRDASARHAVAGWDLRRAVIDGATCIARRQRDTGASTVETTPMSRRDQDINDNPVQRQEIISGLWN